MGLRKQIEYLSALKIWVEIDLYSSNQKTLFINLIQNDISSLEKGIGIDIQKYLVLSENLSELGKTQLQLLKTEITLSKMTTGCFALLAASKFKRNLVKSRTPQNSPTHSSSSSSSKSIIS